MEKHIQNGQLAGGLGLIVRKGHLGYVETWGHADRETERQLHTTDIFRIYSMTKAVTGVAAMMLFEEGAFALRDPVAKFLPEFARMRVAVEEVDPKTGRGRMTGTVPATRTITILDLMRHTAGFNYTGPRDEDGELLYPKRGLQMFAASSRPADFVERLAGAPLVREPGTAWDYGFGTDVLGRLVEVISGATLDEFFREHILHPLGMEDTGFHVPAEKSARLVPIYAPGADGKIQKMTGPTQDGFLQPPAMFAGGGGLVSTVWDYLKFLRMLGAGGELDGVRLLSPLTVELMVADLLGDIPVVNPLLAPGHGFGVTFAVCRGMGPSASLASEGQYRWGGAAGTAFWVDPARDMIGIFMIQTLMDLAKRAEFTQLAYQAIVD